MSGDASDVSLASFCGDASLAAPHERSQRSLPPNALGWQSFHGQSEIVGQSPTQVKLFRHFARTLQALVSPRILRLSPFCLSNSCTCRAGPSPSRGSRSQETTHHTPCTSTMSRPLLPWKPGDACVSGAYTVLCTRFYSCWAPRLRH